MKSTTTDKGIKIYFKNTEQKQTDTAIPLAAQWLRLHAPHAGSPGSTPGQEPQHSRHS